MSAPSGPARRSDPVLDDEASRALLARGFSGNLATTGSDGWPYAVPLIYVWDGAKVYIHTGSAPGRLAGNLRHDPRVCFLVDEPGEEAKAAFCTRLMDKYGGEVQGRPPGFFPRLAAISVYAITVERLSGKAIQLPAAQARWPAIDRTLSPRVQLPARSP